MTTRFSAATFARLLAGVFIFAIAVSGIPALKDAVADSHNREFFSDVRENDPEMLAAIAKARSTLEDFWTQLAEPGAGVSSFALKVLIVDGEKAEHFWLTGVTRSGSRITGTIDNDPVYVKTVQLGERYEFTEADITDWMFIRNGKIVGNETIRPLLKRMPKEKADQFRAMLEEP